MSERGLSEAYDLDRDTDGRSHLWLQNLQATLAERLTEIAPVDVPDRSRARDPRVLSIGAVQAPAPEAGILERLKERKVVQWLLAYLAMTWAILQANDALADVWGVPLMVQRAGSLALALGILPVLVVAWYHGEKGRQRVCCVEAGLIGLTLAVTFGTVWRVCFA